MKTMKILILALTSLMFIGCSTEDDTATDCQCIKEYWEIETYVDWSGGTPNTIVNQVLLYDEPVLCTEEGKTYTSGYTYFIIVCE